MKKLVILLLFALPIAALAQYRITHQLSLIKANNTYQTPCIVAYPPNYDSLRPKPYPVVFYGAGLNSTYAGVVASAPFSQLASGMIPPGEFVIINVYRGSTSWISQTTYAMRQFKKKGMNIDTTNIFITGHSAGGGFSMSSIYGFPDQLNNPFDSSFTANVRAVVALAPNYQDVRRDNYDNIYKFPVPHWIVDGANDNLAYVNFANELNTQANNRLPGIAELKILAGQGHGGWPAGIYNGTTRMESGKTVWEFFISKLRDAIPVPTQVSKYEVVFMSDGTRVIKKISGADMNVAFCDE